MSSVYFDLAEVIIKYCPNEAEKLVDKIEELLDKKKLINSLDDAAEEFLNLWDSYQQTQREGKNETPYPAWMTGKNK